MLVQHNPLCCVIERHARRDELGASQLLHGPTRDPAHGPLWTYEVAMMQTSQFYGLKMTLHRFAVETFVHTSWTPKEGEAGPRSQGVSFQLPLFLLIQSVLLARSPQAS